MFENYILASALSFLIGLVSTMLGVGGGFLMVPEFNLLLGLPIHTAIGTSMTVIIFSSASGLIEYVRQKRVDFRMGFVLVLVTIPGSFLGAYIIQFIEPLTLQVVFGVALGLTSIYMVFKPPYKAKSVQRFVRQTSPWIWSRRLIDADEQIFEYVVNPPLTLVFGLTAGLLAGMLGIGGGVIIVPALSLVSGVPIHVAIATSIFTILFTSTSATIEHLNLGRVDFTYALISAIGVLIGAQMGARVSRKVPAETLKRLFGLILFLLAARMTYPALATLL